MDRLLRRLGSRGGVVSEGFCFGYFSSLGFRGRFVSLLFSSEFFFCSAFRGEKCVRFSRWSFRVVLICRLF